MEICQPDLIYSVDIINKNSILISQLNMITSLTKEQTDKFDWYVKKYTELGLTTTQMTLEEAEKDFKDFQTEILQRKNPAPVSLYKSPTECWARVQEIKKTKNMKFIWPYFDCQFWADWFGFYDYMKNELGIKYSCDKEYEILKRCQRYGMVFPLDEECIVCQPPTLMKTNKSGIHCENGPATVYSDDTKIYALNGVIMDKKYVMAESHEISPEDILKEKNVEVRRELLRKVGIESMFERLPHKLLDKRDEYELYSVDLNDTIKNAKYLKMTNPSIGVFHMEGVDPGCDTVKDALLWRNSNLFENADKLT